MSIEFIVYRHKFFIAMFDPRDSLHKIALILYDRYSKTSLITSQMILVEFLNYYSGYPTYHRTGAVQYIEEVHKSEIVEIVEQSSTLYFAAVELFSNRLDTSWSLTDCASMIICEERKIKDVLTYDKHFEQAGLNALMRDI